MYSGVLKIVPGSASMQNGYVGSLTGLHVAGHIEIPQHFFTSSWLYLETLSIAVDELFSRYG